MVGMCWNQEECMEVLRDDASVGSFLYSVVEGRSMVARSVSMEVRRDVLLPGLSPLGRRAKITLVGWMWSVKSYVVWRLIVMIDIHLYIPISHRGGKVFKYFFGVLDRFALLSKKCVRFLGAHLALNCVSFVVSYVVNRRGCFSDAISNFVVLVKRRKPV